MGSLTGRYPELGIQIIKILGVFSGLAASLIPGDQQLMYTEVHCTGAI